jgi:hypothetical protein
LLAGEPQHIGVEKEKEDEADSEEVHVEAEQDSGLEEVPSLATHATEGVGAANDGDTGRNDNQRVRSIFGEAGEKIGNGETREHESVAAKKRTPVRIEDLRSHAVLEICTGKDRLWEGELA